MNKRVSKDPVNNVSDHNGATVSSLIRSNRRVRKSELIGKKAGSMFRHGSVRGGMVGVVVMVGLIVSYLVFLGPERQGTVTDLDTVPEEPAVAIEAEGRISVDRRAAGMDLNRKDLESAETNGGSSLLEGEAETESDADAKVRSEPPSETVPEQVSTADQGAIAQPSTVDQDTVPHSGPPVAEASSALSESREGNQPHGEAGAGEVASSPSRIVAGSTRPRPPDKLTTRAPLVAVDPQVLARRTEFALQRVELLSTVAEGAGEPGDSGRIAVLEAGGADRTVPAEQRPSPLNTTPMAASDEPRETRPSTNRASDVSVVTGLGSVDLPPIRRGEYDPMEDPMPREGADLFRKIATLFQRGPSTTQVPDQVADQMAEQVPDPALDQVANRMENRSGIQMPAQVETKVPASATGQEALSGVVGVDVVPAMGVPEEAPEPTRSPKEGVLTPLVAVSGGAVGFGAVPGDKIARSDELPRVSVSVDPFLIEAHEVTNRQYKAFIDDTGYDRVPMSDDPEDSRYDWDPTSKTYPPGTGDYPVVNVSRADAEAYAEWAGRRLPTEVEWEMAARAGVGEALYPWGNSYPDRVFANFDGQGLVPVERYRSNGFGVYDLAGNAFEWVADAYDPHIHSRLQSETYPPTRGEYGVLKGGAFYSTFREVRTSYRENNYPTTRFFGYGFRLAADAKE